MNKPKSECVRPALHIGCVAFSNDLVSYNVSLVRRNLSWSLCPKFPSCPKSTPLQGENIKCYTTFTQGR